MPLTPPPSIESPRLLLRIVEDSDIPALLAINGDDEVTCFLPYETWQSLADGQAWFKRMSALGSAGSCLQFVIVEKTSGTVIGTCLIFRHEPASARAEIGYVLARVHWGKGLMREALSTLIAYAFDTCELRRLEAEVNPENLASNQLLLRLGFTLEGVLRKRWVAKGNAYDTNIYGLLRDE